MLPVGDAVELARRRAPRPGDRLAQLRGPPAPPGHGRLGPVRRLADPGLPRAPRCETDRTNAIIDDDPGAILVKGKHDRAINAFYHSTGGGATENNEYAFVGPSGAVTATPVKYLRGIADRAADGTPFDAASPWASWRTPTLTRAQLSAIMGKDPRTNVGDVTKLDLTHRGVSGRLYRVTVTGSKGSKTVSASMFVSVYNAGRPAGSIPLRSTLFDTRPIK